MPMPKPNTGFLLDESARGGRHHHPGQTTLISTATGCNYTAYREAEAIP